MKHKLLFTCSACLFVISSFAQPNGNDKAQAAGRSNEASLNINFPFEGYLKDISNLGLGLEYGWSNGRFGKMIPVPSKPIGFTYNAGIDYYFGQKEDVGMNSYKYEGTTYFHVYGGAIFNPCNRGNISLTAGPGVELYNGNAEFGFGVNLSGSYYICNCGNFGISPNITLMKQGSSEVVVSGGLKVKLTF
jgi:hypothetical protein